MKYIKLFILGISLFFVGINCYAEENNLITDNPNTIDNNLVIKENQKLFDFADIYTKKEEKKLNKKIGEYIKTTDIDPIILTTKALDGKTISTYTSLFYQKNNFNENTVLFVIYINDVEPEIYMYGVGKKTTKYYTDDRIGQILEYVYDDIDNKKYYDATDKYLTIIKAFYDIDNDNYYLGKDGKLVKYIPWVEIIILSIALSFIVVMLFVYRIIHNNKIVNRNVLDNKLDSNTLVVSTVKDELVDTVVSK